MKISLVDLQWYQRELSCSLSFFRFRLIEPLSVFLIRIHEILFSYKCGVDLRGYNNHANPGSPSTFHLPTQWGRGLVCIRFPPYGGPCCYVSSDSSSSRRM